MATHSISYVQHDDDYTSQTLTVAFGPGGYTATLTLSGYEDDGEGILRVLDTSEPEIVAQRGAERFRRTTFYAFTDEVLAAWLAGKYADCFQ